MPLNVKKLKLNRLIAFMHYARYAIKAGTFYSQHGTELQVKLVCHKINYLSITGPCGILPCVGTLVVDTKTFFHI